MIASLIRAISSHSSVALPVEEDKAGEGELGQLKIALITDGMTTLSLAKECRIRQLTPYNYDEILRRWRPHLVFVESAFYGVHNAWLYHIAKQARWLQQKKPQALENLLNLAKSLNIPTLFWNKDDFPFFNAFVHVAKQVDYVFTADSNFIPHYQAAVQNSTQVHLLAMAYQPLFHSFTGFHFKAFEPCFLGSYYRRMLPERQQIFNMIFNACSREQVKLHVYDRHKNHPFRLTHFRYPKHAAVEIHHPVPYSQTQDMYKYYGISLNINSVTNSETMLSRRFLEILACGGILVTNASPAVENNFSAYCHCIKNEEHMRELLARLKYGPTREDKERAESGAQYVLQNHTWRKRLEQIVNTVRLGGG